MIFVQPQKIGMFESFFASLLALGYTDTIIFRWPNEMTPESFVADMIKLCGCEENLELTENNFYVITPTGYQETGILGMVKWIAKRKMNIHITN